MRHRNMVDQDRVHLQLLAIFHYVLAGLQVLGGCFPLMYVGIGFVLLMASLDNNDPNRPPPIVGIMMMVIASTFVLFLWGLAVLKVIAGYSLNNYSRYRFCFVVAALECLNVPTGTVLGIFTIMVLSRPAVKALFEGEPLHDPLLDAYADELEAEPRALPAPAPARPDHGSYSENPPPINPD